MIDTHCHIDLYSHPEMLLKECEQYDLTVLAMTNLPSHFEIGYEHVLPFKKIRLALGMHPLYAEQHEKEIQLFYRNLPKTSYIGEVGLDFSREGYSTKDVQVRTFEKILKKIEGQKKLLSIHSRRAEKEVLQMLLNYQIPAAIFHWYSGPVSLIDKIVDAGYYFSINPMMTQSESGRKIIDRIPQANLLTETDGPFSTVDGRPTKPFDVVIVYQYFSKIWGANIDEIGMIISSNFKTLLLNIK